MDGGVIELSTDAGTTWKDISTWAAPGYGGLIEKTTDSAIASQPAYVGMSAGFPALTPVTLDLGTQLGGATVLLRFRAVSNRNHGDMGWFIDDIQVNGITNLPFTSFALSSPATVFSDDDGDGHGGPQGQSVCPQPDGSALTSGDCDDADATVHPGAPEPCDGIDNDCDGETDEGYDLGDPCTVGEGACAESGVMVCGDDGDARCEATTGPRGGETCGEEAGSTAPGADAGSRAPDADAGGTAPGADAGGTAPGADAGGTAPGADSGSTAPGADSGGTAPGADSGGAVSDAAAGDGATSASEEETFPADAAGGCSGCDAGRHGRAGGWMPGLLLVVLVGILRRSPPRPRSYAPHGSGGSRLAGMRSSRCP